MESLTLQPIARVDGTINLPGSKSVSNRALLLAALANGTTVLTNLLDSDDVRHMLNALKALGVHYTLSDDRTRCEVTGNGGALRSGEELELFLGNAGTAMRPLAAALCLGSNNIVLTGEPLARVLFEVVSAYATCGLSVGLSGEMGPAGKAVLIVVMFIGRIGTTTVATALALRSRRRLYHYPEESLIIG